MLRVALCGLLLVATQVHAQTCPAGNPRVAPDSRYSVTEPVPGQRVVTDLRTGLMWKQCVQGRSGAGCATGADSTLTWTEALNAANAENHAGHSDWRLPSLIELRSLIESGCHTPAINTTVFPNASSDAVRSSTTVAPTNSGAWSVFFDDGDTFTTAKSPLGERVRLVRGGGLLDGFNSGLDFTPNSYTFAAQSDVPLSSLQTSNSVSVSGITTVTSVGISGAAGSQYRINGGEWTSAPGQISNGDLIEVRHTSAAVLATATTTTLTIGGVSANFITTTILTQPCPATVVTNGNDSGAGSLRQVIADACPGSTVTFQSGITTVSLTSAELSIDKSLSIEGATGVTITRAAGSPDFRIFRILSGHTVSMNAVTISNGRVTGNGGGILNQGALTLTNSTLSGNHASDDGGGMDSLNAPVSIIGSSLSGNSAGRFAAAVFRNSAATLRNCTVAGNTAPDTGGLGFDGGAPATVTNCSVVGNTSVAIVVAISDRPTSTLTLVNSLVAMPGSLAISGVVSLASSNNLIQASPGFGAGGMVDGVDGNIVSTANPRVGSLGNFGGSTQTVALLPGSPAINAGTTTGAPATDQRGIARVGNVDIGAFESRGFALAISGGNSQSAEINTAFANPLAVTVSSAFGEPVAGGGVTFTPPGAGASAVLTGSPATISAAGVASAAATANGNAGSYAVTASATGATGVNLSLQNTAPPNSDLSITLTDSPDPVVAGGTFSYTLTVSNGGFDAILASQTFSIRSSLPAGLSGCSYTPSGGTFSVGTIASGATGTGTWTGVALAAPGGTATLTIACTASASAAASLSHTATVFPPSGILDPDCSGVPLDCVGNNTATTSTAVARPQLTLTKTASLATFVAGTPASFTLQLSNTGTAATTAVSTITDTIPSGLTIGTLPAGCTAASQTVSCTVPAGLAASGSASFVIPVTATVAAAASVTNTAAVSGGGDTTCPANARCTSAVTVAISGTCATVSFPYTLAGADNSARVANLRTAIECANLNSSVDVIDLNGQSLTLTDAFANYSGATGLPQIASVIRLRNGSIVRSSAAPDFRLLAMNAAADLTLEQMNLQGGRLGSLEDGGAIFNNSGTLTLLSTFVTNSQAGFSGAIYHENAALRIVDSVVSGNTTANIGVITNASGSVTIIDSTFAGNSQTTASGSAGVIYNAFGTVTVVGSVFANNSAVGAVGAIQNFGGTVHIANSAFTGNRATSPTSFAGALFNNSGTMTIANSRITGNTAGIRAGGLYAQGGSLTISNSTIAGNSASTDGGITIASGTSTLVNSILWGNSSAGTLTGTAVSYSIVEGGFAGTGNLDVDPLFVAPVAFTSAPTSAGDYRLQSYSPATDAGSNAAVPLDTFDVNGNANTTEEAPDLAGNPRRTNDTGIVDSGSGTAPIVDLGAYERQTNSVVVAASVAPTSLSLSEAGSTVDSFVVSLNEAPSVNVTVQLNFDGNVQVDTGGGFGASPQTVTLTPANALAGVTVNVRAVDDAIDEASPHTSTIMTSATSSTNPGFNGLTVADVTVSITDNDTPGVTVTQTGGTTEVAEGGATDSFTVVLTSQPTANVSIALTGSQVTPTPTPLTFTSGNWNVAQTVTVTAIDDAIDEASPHTGSVSFAVTSGDSNYDTFAVPAVSVQVSDNDTAGVTVTESGGNTAVTEGGATDSYTVVLQSEPTGNVTVVLSTTAQLSLAPPGLTFTPANWNVAQTVTVTATDDGVVEGPHNATINQSVTSSDPNYSQSLPAISVAISDNDSAVVNFAPVSQSEGTSPMAFTVTLSNPVASGVTLTLNSANGTATAADYTPISGATVSFPASSAASQTVNVVIANDALDEDDETFTLTLSGLTATGNVTLSSGTPTLTAGGTILDDDATPTLSITSPSQDEGNAGPSTMTFTVSLGAVSGRNVSFTRATADGSATVANNDYVAIASGSLSIPAGQTSLTIPVTINGDTVFEGNETFSVNLTGITNATPGTLTGTGTIVEDDQQPTTTTITSDLPDPTVVGQPYTVNVTVAAVTTSPTGTVTISDGSTSCGPVTLTAATAPNSTASCSLTSTTAGAKTLTASYTAATTAFGNSSGTTSHQVNPASTSISVTGPTRSRINQPTSFSFALGVNAPGAGTPTGTVTLTSGASSCTATLPATSCNLSFSSLGSRTVSASYAGDGNFSASTSSGAGNAQTLVYALADLSVTKNDGVPTYEPGDLLVYSVIVRNLGPDAAANIRISDNIPAGLTDVTWSCDDSGGVACPVTGGSGNLDLTIASFPVGGLLNLTFYGNVDGSPASIANTATITLPADTTIEDPALGNNTATDTDLLDGLFANGFEDPQVNAPTGSVRIPAIGLARTLADEASIVLRLTDAQGEAVRVYARMHAQTLQYALARRNASGQLRLGAWTALPGEPTLSWTARQVATGWVVDTVALR